VIEYIVKILRAMESFAKWYNERHPLVKALIFFTLFILPALIIAYLRTMEAYNQYNEQLKILTQTVITHTP